LFAAGRVFAADMVDGHGAWRELAVPSDAPGARGLETPVLSAAVDDATGAVFVERPGGWLRIVDDGAAVHSAVIDDGGSVPAALTLRQKAQSRLREGTILAAAVAGDELLTVTSASDGAFVKSRSGL
jgi:hypothetical protein